MEYFLAPFNATLKYSKSWEPILLIFIQSSRTLQLAKMILWWLKENVCLKIRKNVPTWQNVGFKLHFIKRYTDHPSAVKLSRIRFRQYKITPLCWEHSKKVFQPLRTVSSWYQKTKRRDSHFKCRCRENKVAGWHFIRVSEYGSQTTHCDKILKRWKEARCF